MPANVTLSQLRTRTRFLSGLENSRSVSDARLNEVINASIRKVWDLLLRHRPDPYTTEQTPAPVTVANQASVALAANFYRLREVEVLDSGNYFRMRPINVSEAWRFENSTSQPRALRYRVQSNSLVIVPTPSAAYTLRVYYYPSFTALALDTDTFDGVNGYEDLVIARSIVDIKLRDSMPFGDWQSRVEVLQREIMEASADVDAGQPFFLSGTGPEGGYNDDWIAP
jgi:hypothetical protein